MKNKWMDKRVLVIGAARQGMALARFLVEHGAQVTLNDGQTQAKLQTSIDQLIDLPVRWVLGSHPLELIDDIDMVCVSGGVPLDIPLIQAAKQQNIPLSNDSQIFMEIVPCPVIGITGSAGKTTTTTLIGEIASKDVHDDKKVWVGGNIGYPLINQIGMMSENDLVILELSSFQLELMSKSPHISVITNITPNHLDRHKTMEAYSEAKANILNFQNSDDFSILNRDDPGSIGLKDKVKGKIVTFGFSELPNGTDGAFIKNNSIWTSFNGIQNEIINIDQISLPGKHNITNVLAASTIATILGISPDVVSRSICEFKGVPHRLQLVREWKGVKWINDSKATTPQGSIAAIQSFSGPIVLLLGGKDKNLPWESLLEIVNEKVDHLILFGEASKKINGYLQKMNFVNPRFTLDITAHLEEAVNLASKLSKPGDNVLLSPGGTSYDEFKDFEERGERFMLWVHQLQ